jgi:hypothetical protein
MCRGLRLRTLCTLTGLPVLFAAPGRRQERETLLAKT